MTVASASDACFASTTATGSIPPVTTRRFPFDEIEEAFRLMETKEDGVIKPLIDFET